jgi:hypothetical protein
MTTRENAWEPGVSSRIPHAFQGLETIARPDCVFPEAALIDDFGRLTGLPREELVAFRPSRLALHELIVRVTADVAVPEGRTEEIFGQNFRRIAGHILAHDLAPHLARFDDIHAALRRRVFAQVRAMLDERLAPPPAAEARPASWLAKWFGTAKSAPVPRATLAEREHAAVARFKTEGLAAGEPFERAVFRSLYRVLGAVLACRGQLGADHALLAEIVSRHVGNTYGSRLIGAEIEPLMAAAIEREGYPRVPTRAAPVMISLKGPSAAGKSSIRPMLKRLMHEHGIEPDGYATISPDVWRRLLLDYEALGEAYKYAGHLTSRELMVVDGKLDRYIRDKARQARAIPHLLVDRFRFDSFSTREIGRILQGTYAQYVSTIHMYFIVTPPEETVERGWQRALERGRYKAVEDFLGHCIEAYSGMPRVLFRWLGNANADFRYYFLDNRVPKGHFPTSIATGNRDFMAIYDPLGLINIDRYQKINIHARCREEVYPDGDALAVSNNLGFLRQCLRAIPVVRFFDGPEGVAYLEYSQGSFRVLDPVTFAKVSRRDGTAAILWEIVPSLMSSDRTGPGSAPA